MTPFTVTFYSYKGGVGRTLLAANIGVLCARRGKTLLWDLDIEAPGMHHIPDLKPAIPAEQGFFDWLLAWQNAGFPRDADFPGLIGTIRPTNTERLSILPAYAGKTDFAAAYQAVNWNAFLVDDLDCGLAVFRAALAAIGEAGFETVILDARTGITDIGGLLAGLLPDVTVLVGSYGAQNTYGLAHVWKALEPACEGKVTLRGDRYLRRLLVASPIPELDPQRIAIGESGWKEVFGIAPKEITTIPYDQDLLFSEELASLRRPDARVAHRYAELEQRLEGIRHDIAAEATQQQRNKEARPDRFESRGRRSVEQGKTFEERVAHLLRLLGYTVEREQLIDSYHVDLVARKRGDFGREEIYFVECKDQRAAVPKETVQTLKNWISEGAARQMKASGMVVAMRDFSPQARGYAREQGIQALTYDELERGLFDFSPYLARIRQRYEASPLAANYVDQFLQLEKQADSAPMPMLPHALAWANGAGSRLWLVLGDYGTGKSTLVERFAYELALRAETDPDAVVPITINLRAFPNAISLESLLREHLEAELRTVLNPEIVLHLLEAGRVVLLLDSFDEMGVAQAGRSVEDQFRQLVRPTASAGANARSNRVLITSRSHFFRDSGSARRALQGGDPLFEPDSPLGKAARAFDATIDALPPFTPEQIDAYLTRRLGEVEAGRARQRIADTYGLAEIAATPQLLDMIVASLPDLVVAGGRMTTAALYLTYTNRWLGTIRLIRAEVGIDHLRELLERMACELWRRPQNRIHYADLAQLLRTDAALARGIDSERVDLELRTATFLVRSADGYYRFSHRSFLEFFLARAALHALRKDRLADALDYGRINPEASRFLLDLVEAEASSAQQFDAAIRNLLAAPYRAGVSENALLLANRSARYRAEAQAPAALARNEISAQMLHDAHRSLIPDHAQLAGAQLAGADLAYLYAPGIDLRNADLSDANLRDTCLDGAKLDGANLDDALLVRARLVSASLIATQATRIYGRGLILDQAYCREATFDGADLRGLHANGTDFSNARLRHTRLADAHAESCILTNTTLTGATWPRTSGPFPAEGLAPRRARVVGLAFGHLDSVNSVAFSHDDRFVLSAGFDYSVRLRDSSSGKEIRRFDGHFGPVNSAAFSHDGHFVLSGGYDYSVRLWDVSSGKEIRRFDGHSGQVNSAVFSHNSHFVLSAADDGSVRLWDVSSGEEIKRFDGHSGVVNSTAFSHDDRLILSAGNDSSVRLWNAFSGEEIHRFNGHSYWARSTAFSHDDRFILSAGDDSSVRLWDASSGEEIRRFDGHSGGVLSAVFSHDDRFILSAGDDSSIRLWDASSGKEIRRFNGHSGPVNSAVFSHDDRFVLSAGNDGTVRLWDVDSGSELRAMSASDESWIVWGNNRWDGEGWLTDRLRYEDLDETVDPADPVPRLWSAADLPEYRGLTALPSPPGSATTPAGSSRKRVPGK